MKISTLALSFCGFWVFYICNADWIDELIETYLATDYEDVAPFVSSVTGGAEEFDQIVEELSHLKRRWWFPAPLLLAGVLSFLSLSVLLRRPVPSRVTHGRRLLEAALKFVSHFKNSGADKEEIQTIVTEFLENKLKQLVGSKEPDDVPVKLLWKGGTLVESSVHCNIKDESKLQHMQRHLLHSKLLFGQKRDKVIVAPSSSETSMAQKMAEIRRLLESEQELEKFLDKTAETTGQKEGYRELKDLRPNLQPQQPPTSGTETLEVDHPCTRPNDEGNSESKANLSQKKAPGSDPDSEWDSGPDPKLMNRIRLLESRLRLEELKNKNWITRMSRAEGILQKLNKQVEQIEETRPMGTMTETLKITSTVTNWPVSARPKKNMRFTLVNQYPPFCVQMPYMSLSELIKKEVGLPAPDVPKKNLFQLPPTPQIPALPSPIVMPSSSFLSKFLCR